MCLLSGWDSASCGTKPSSHPLSSRHVALRGLCPFGLWSSSSPVISLPLSFAWYGRPILPVAPWAQVAPDWEVGCLSYKRSFILPGSTLTLLSLTVLSPLCLTPHLPSSALFSVYSPILPSDTGRGRGQECSRLESCPQGMGSGGDDGHRKGGRTGSFQCLVSPAIPMSSGGQLPKEGAGGDPRKTSSHGNCMGRGRGLDSVCSVHGSGSHWTWS